MGNIKILMKKFTISFFVTVVFTVVSMLSCFSVSAQEQEMTASITFEEFMELDTEQVYVPQITLGSDESYSFYNQLDDNNKAAYDAIESAWTEPNVTTVKYALTDKVTYKVESTDTSTWTEEQTAEFWNLVFATFQSGETAFMYDYPEVFWYKRNEIAVSISMSKSYSYRTGLYTITVNSVTLTPRLRGEFADEQEALDAQNLLVEQINALEVEGEDNYTKLKFMHDYISLAVTYNIGSIYADTAFGVFNEPFQVICEGYSECFKMLCDKEGIPCISVIGNIETEINMAHMWNYVKMEDGNWYAVDVTWDDLDKEDEPLKYQYFLKGSESFLSNHTPDNSIITPGFIYPELNPEDYVYLSDEPVVTTVTTSAVTTTSETTTTSLTTTEKATTTSLTTTEKTTTSKSVTTSKTTTSKATVTTEITTTVTETPVVTTTVPETEVVKGDFNHNDVLDVADVVLLQKKLLGKIEITSEDYAYETLEDEKLNIWDYIVLVRMFKL